MPEQKEIEDFLTRFGGALTGAAEDALLESYFNYAVMPGHPFPYVDLGYPLPFGDDLLVGGLSIPPWVIGYLAEEEGKKRGDTKMQEMGKALKKFGEGDVFYTVPMLIKNMLIRATNTVPMPTQQAQVTGAGRPYQPQGNQPQPVSMVYKL